MRIDVSAMNIEKVSEIGKLIEKSFPEAEISVKQKGDKITMKIVNKKLEG